MSTELSRSKLNIWGYNTIAKQIFAPIILGVVVFLLAGTTDWSWGWVFNIVHVLVWVGMTLVLIRTNPDLLNARGRQAAGFKFWDFVLVSLYGLAWIAVVVVGALDYRYGWTGEFPAWLASEGAMLMVVGFGIMTWAMVVNRHFETLVRMQDDRGHDVITDGPYRYVRHPGYVGVIIAFFIGMPLLLNSIYAVIPAVIGGVVMVIRTGLEDRALQNELPGYTDYAEETRYRLVPWLW